MATVLLAGDDFNTFETLRLTVEGEGHTAVHVMDGFEAHQAALEHHPDLVIVQAAMPIFNGFETCEMLREDPEIPATIPILILSSEDIDVKKLESVRATDVLDKNASSVELVETLVNLLGDKARGDSTNPTE